MKLTNQQRAIVALLGDGLWHCTKEINDLYIRDDRKRISELKAKGYVIDGKKCDMHHHTSPLFMRRLISIPQELVEPQIKFEEVQVS